MFIFDGKKNTLANGEKRGWSYKKKFGLLQKIVSDLVVGCWYQEDLIKVLERVDREIFVFFGTRSQENQHHVQESSAAGEIPIPGEKMHL